MNEEIRELHSAMVDLMGFLNQPQRDAALIKEAGVSLDRALFPLLVMIERHGPVGVVELAGLVGRDHTTVSRQLATLGRRKLIVRRSSPTDGRSHATAITKKGRAIIDALNQARERLARHVFADWSEADVKTLARLMRQLTQGLMSIPLD